MNRTQEFEAALSQLNEGQRQAVESIEGPVMVIAGPGTGKTQVIAARIGNILLQPDISPYNVLCLTYTEAATIAMRSRLIKFIGPTAYNIEIHTFHAFSNNVIQNNLYHFGGFRDLQPLTDLEDREIYENLVDDLPNDHLLKRLTGNIYYETNRLRALFQLMKKENWSVEEVEKAVDDHLIEMEEGEDFRYKRNMPSKGIAKGDLNVKKFETESQKFQMLKAGAGLYNTYQDILKEKSRYDFQDMILWVLKAFDENPDLLADYQERFQYILVDEYQDTNGSQNDLLYKLCDYWDSPNVFVVGDDDQSIYRFQGANTSNILEFRNRFKNQIKEIVLTNNYRSTQPILDSSRSLIVRGGGRLETAIAHINKELLAARLKDQGTKPQVIEYYNEEHEMADIIKMIEKAHNAKKDLSKIAVIYRNHKQVEKIVTSLQQKGIPLNLKRKFNVLEEKWLQQIIDIMTYISTEVENPHSGDYLLSRLMYCSFFKIHPNDIARIAMHCSYNAERRSAINWRYVLEDERVLDKLNLRDKNSVLRYMENLNKWITESENLTIQVLFERIFNFSGMLGEMLNSEDKTWKIQVLSTFFDFLKEETKKTKNLSLKDFLLTLERMNNYNITIPIQRIVYSANGVHFITAHSSKGLEFEKVFLIGALSKKWEAKANRSMTYKIPPQLIEGDDDKLDEERRLFYVAMTRAEQDLRISYSSKTAEEKDQQGSRFLTELIEDGVVEKSMVTLSDEEMLTFSVDQITSKEPAQLELIDKEGAEKTLRKYQMSVTGLNKYLECPITFYFDNVLRIPSARTVHMGFGQAVHRALELMFNDAKKTGTEPNKGLLLEFFESSMAVYHSHFTPKEREDRMAFGLQVLPDYYDKYIEQWKTVGDFEMEYGVNQVEYKGVPLKGRLDKVDVTDNKVFVTDFKTGKPDSPSARPKLKAPKEEEDRGGDYWRQIVYYKILLDKDLKSNWVFQGGALDFVQPSSKGEIKKYTFNVNPEDIDLVGGQIESSYKSIMNYEFSQGCGKEDCKWCNFVKFNKLDVKPSDEEGDEVADIDFMKEEIDDV